MKDLIEALQIFLKYGNPGWPTHCAHDVMYVIIDYDTVSDEDKNQLEKLGFIKDNVDGEGFMSYRYGSA